MSKVPIPNLTAAISINGNEQLEAVQAGASVRITSAQIAALAAGIGFPTIVGTLLNIAALRQLGFLALSSIYSVSGYLTAGDGGGGQFVYVSTDTTSADNGGTIIVDSIGRRWYRIFSTPLSPLFFGARGDLRQSGDGSMTSGQAVVTSPGMSFKQSDIGKYCSVYDAGTGFQSLVGTISSVSGNTATLNAAASNTVASVRVKVSSDDTAAILATIAVAMPASGIEENGYYQGGNSIDLGPRGYGFINEIFIPGNTNIIGRGPGISVLCSMAPPALINMDNRVAAGQGGSFANFTVDGNNIAGAGIANKSLWYIGKRVFLSFYNVAIGYAWCNGLFLEGTQNGTFQSMLLQANGDYNAGTGTNLTLKNDTAGNVFSTTEFTEACQRHVSFEMTVNGNLTDNVIEYGRMETYKGEFDVIPKTLKITNYMDYDCPLGGGNNILKDTGFSSFGLPTFSGSHLNMISNSLQGHNLQFDSDPAHLTTGVTLRNNAFLELDGFMYVRNLKTLYDTGPGTVIIDRSDRPAGLISVTNRYTSTDGVPYETRVNCSYQAPINLGSGQIIFPSTSNPSASQSVLDDYREVLSNAGLVVVTIGGSSIGITGAFGITCVKIGRLVNFTINLVFTSLGGLSGTVVLDFTSLPTIFLPGATPCFSIAGQVQNTSVTAGSNLVFGIASAQTLTPQVISNSGSGANLTAAMLANNSAIACSGFYFSAT